MIPCEPPADTVITMTTINKIYSNKRAPCHLLQLFHQILYKMMTLGEVPPQYDTHTVAPKETRTCVQYNNEMTVHMALDHHNSRTGKCTY